ncbi:MAG: PaaI family thioesterase [Pseudomonadota bacterium]
MSDYGLEQMRADFARSPAIAAHQIEVMSFDEARGELTLRMPLTTIAERGGDPPMFHGGSISLFIDVAGDFAVAMAIGGGVPTMNLRVDYLRPAFGPALTAVARARRIGRSVAVVDIDVQDTQDRLCSVGRGTYSTKVG